MTFSKKLKYIPIDGWRGYYEPIYGICGANDTGTAEDSPCNSNTCKKELKSIKDFLKSKGFETKAMVTETSNCFCVKRCLIVEINQDIEEARHLVKEYLNSNETELLYPITD